MRIETAIAELKGVRLALAFAPPDWVRPGPGDALIARLAPYLPPLPVMLVGDDGRTYAPFQTHEFAARLRRAALATVVVDLDAAPPPRACAPPF